jgi:PAS domain S-box-containing protein
MPAKPEMRSVESWMELTLASLDRGVVALDESRRVVYVNRRAEEMLGQSAEELMGREICSALSTRDDRWLDTEGSDRLGVPDEERDLRIEVGGREVVLHTSPVEIMDLRNARVGTAVLLEEADEGDQDLEQERKIDRLISLGELSAYVAHEIRNPLTGIRTTVQFVGSKFPHDDPLKSDLEDVIQEIDRIEQIITSLLVFARPPTGKPAPTQVADVVNKALDNLEPQCEAARVSVGLAVADAVPLVLADSDLLLQVFLNLLLNAIQAMPNGGSLAVSVISKRTRHRRNMVEVSISDTGQGIPQENLEKIFAPFFTTRPTGTGLGLAISQQIIREYGGLISAANRPSGGAQFRVMLPGLSARKAAQEVERRAMLEAAEPMFRTSAAE